MEQRLQNVLIPKNSVSFKVQLNDSWRREYGEFVTVFGLYYRRATIALLFKADGNLDGTITGSWWAWMSSSLTDREGEFKKISDIATFDSEHEFEIGHDDDEIFIIEKKSPIAVRQAFDFTDPGDATSFVTPDFKFRPMWNVKVKLL